MPYEFYFSIDAHESNGRVEYAAALIEKSDEDGDANEYRAHALKRYSDDSPDDVAEDLLSTITEEPFTGRTSFVMNVAEAAGRRLHEALTQRGVSPITVSVTGGDTSAEQGRPLSFDASPEQAVHVSEREIVSAVEGVYRSGRFDLEAIKDNVTSALVRGLETYQVEEDVEDVEETETRASNQPEPRRLADDAELVFAAGTACWLAEQQSFDPTEHLAGDPPPVRRAKQEMRPDTA